VVVGLAAVPAVAASGANQVTWTTSALRLANVPGGIKVYLQAQGAVGVNNPSTSTVVATVKVTNAANPSDTKTVVFSSQPLIVPAGWGQVSNQEELVIAALTVGSTYDVKVTATSVNANSLAELTGTIIVNQWG